MLLNHFTPKCFADGSAWKNENRLTLSSVKDISISKYQAPTYGIKYVIKGTEHYVIRGKDYPVSAGNFLLVNNEESIDVAVRSQENVTGLCIHLEPSLIRILQAQLSCSDEQLLTEPYKNQGNPEIEHLIYCDKENKLGKYLNLIATHIDSSEILSPLEQNAIYYNLGTEMLLTQTPATQLTVTRNRTKAELIRRLSIARSYIEAHAMENIDVNQVAKEAMMSAPHLYRSFKKVYGISPYQYTTQVRLQKARQLLQRGFTPGEVYANCGYADLPSFSKAFKKVFGVSPSGQMNS